MTVTPATDSWACHKQAPIEDTAVRPLTQGRDSNSSTKHVIAAVSSGAN